MRLDLERHRHDYAARGWTILRVLDADTAMGLAGRFADAGIRVESEGDTVRYPGDSGGRCAYTAVEGQDVTARAPEVAGLYHGLLPLLAAVTQRDVVLSPYPKSAISVVVYRGAGDEMEWHHDSNGISLLLYLSDNPTDGGTALVDLAGNEVTVWPRAGSALLFQGRSCRHRSEPLKGPGLKVSCPMNYYEAGDVSRPEGWDYEDIVKRVA